MRDWGGHTRLQSANIAAPSTPSPTQLVQNTPCGEPQPRVLEVQPTQHKLCPPLHVVDFAVAIEVQ